MKCNDCFDTGKLTCMNCGGTGMADEYFTCKACQGSGEVTCDMCETKDEVPGAQVLVLADYRKKETLSEQLETIKKRISKINRLMKELGDVK